MELSGILLLIVALVVVGYLIKWLFLGFVLDLGRAVVTTGESK